MSALNLRQRLLALAILPSILLAVTLGAYFAWSGSRALEVEMSERGQAVVRYLAPMSEYGMITGNQENLQSLVQAALLQPNVKAAVIVNRNGRTLAVSGRVTLSSEQLRTTPMEAGLIAETSQWAAFGAPIVRTLADEDDYYTTDTSRSARPDVLGQLFIEFDKSELDRKQIALTLHGGLIIFIGLLLVMLMALNMADSLIRPVTRLLAAIQSIRSGELSTRVPADSFAEFGVLEQGFNAMASRIEEVHHTMQSRIEEATAQLAYQARHDMLTGLINRREFENQLDKLVGATRAGGPEGAMLVLDLDHFKPVNDTCGHAAGDELLRQLSSLLQGRLRTDDHVARIGGDEFAILLPACPLTQAKQVADDLCNLISDFRFIWHGKIFSISASIGLIGVTRQAENGNELLEACDAACYAAKEAGRGQVILATPPQHNQERRQAQFPAAWPDRLRATLEAGGPIFDAIPLSALCPLWTPMPTLVEVACRLDERRDSALPTHLLWETADRYGMAMELFARSITLSAQALHRAQTHGRELVCLVTLPPNATRQPKLLEVIQESVGNQTLSRANLIFLMTETSASQQPEEARRLCAQLKGMGYQIALDAFGEGFASFGLLRSLQPQFVRISSSLAQEAGSHSTQTILRAIQELCADLQILTLVGNISDTTAIEHLRAAGIHFVQGPAIAPSEPFGDWLEGTVFRGLPPA